MGKILGDCKEGDYVQIWCIGTLCWDDEVVKIKKQCILTEVEYKDGSTGRFSTEAICKVVSF